MCDSIYVLSANLYSRYVGKRAIHENLRRRISEAKKTVIDGTSNAQKILKEFSGL